MRSQGKQGLPAGWVPVSAYGGSEKNLQDLKQYSGGEFIDHKTSMTTY